VFIFTKSEAIKFKWSELKLLESFIKSTRKLKRLLYDGTKNRGSSEEIYRSYTNPEPLTTKYDDKLGRRMNRFTKPATPRVAHAPFNFSFTFNKVSPTIGGYARKEYFYPGVTNRRRSATCFKQL